MYLALDWPKVRPPKATTRPRRSVMGKMIRSKK
jgi:hypothetical protein